VSRALQAVILAGGLGVRLRPLTLAVPKPMAPVAGKPYLEHQLALLSRQGIGDIVILTGYLGDQIERHFGDGSRLGLTVRYSREELPLGTGGAILRARPLLAEEFLVIYGDSYLPIDYAEVLGRLADRKADGVLVVYDNRHGDTAVRNNVALGAGGLVERYAKDVPGTAGLTHVDAGVAALRRAALDLWDGAAERWSIEAELYTRLISRRRLLAYETRQRFYDIGTPERLKLIEGFLTR
jgi:NDP-sugar pyrophosphorylase family protein